MESSYEYEMAEKKFLPYGMGYLTEWMVQIAKEELDETEETRSKALSELRRLIANEKQLKTWTDDAYLLQFLRARKFDVKRAWDLLRHLYEVKRDFPEVYPRDIDIENIKSLQEESNGGGAYPYRDKNGSTILFYKIGRWDPEKFPLSVALSAMTFALLQCIEDPATQVCGIHIIVDAEGLSLKQLRQLTPRYMQLFGKALRNTLPIRFKGVHIVNESLFFSYLYSLLKLFLSEKIKKRMHFHGSDMKHLHKYIPKDILPPEYEGDNINYCASDFVKKEMYPYFEKFRELHRRGFC